MLNQLIIIINVYLNLIYLIKYIFMLITYLNISLINFIIINQNVN